MSVHTRKDLIAARVAMANQLRAHLQTALPGVIGLFRDIDSQLTLAFLRRFPQPGQSRLAVPGRLGNWLHSIGYNHQANLDRLWAHLHEAPRGITGPEAAPRAQITLALVAVLTAIRDQIHTLDQQIAQQLAAHPDAAIFTSLPRASTNRVARLLAEIGDARGRFPTPEALTCLAGAAPSTRQSGKVKIVAFRWAVDKQLRGAVIDFAGDSPRQPLDRSPLPKSPRPRTRPPHAARIRARAWLHIIGRCWQDNTPYNRDKHTACPRPRTTCLTQGYSCRRRCATRELVRLGV
jgi:transposase